MNSFVWGSDMWNLLHATTLKSPTRHSPEDVSKFKRLLENFRAACPCAVCQASFQELLTLEKFDVNAAIDPAVFAWELHNAVNTKLGKPEITYENVFRRYNHAVEPLTSAQVWQLIYPVVLFSEQQGNAAVGREFAEAAVDLARTLPALRDSEPMTELRAVLADDSHSSLGEKLMNFGMARFGEHCSGTGKWCSVTRGVTLKDMREVSR